MKPGNAVTAEVETRYAAAPEPDAVVLYLSALRL